MRREGRKGVKRNGKKKGETKGKGKAGKEDEAPPNQNFWLRHSYDFTKDSDDVN